MRPALRLSVLARPRPQRRILTVAPSLRNFSTSRPSLNSTTTTTTTTTPSPDAPPRARKPSPYRLPSLPVFLADFAPLHVAGWRLALLPESHEDTGGTTSHAAGTDVLSGADLQGRCLVRAYAFPRDRGGWRALNALMAKVGEAVEVEDHHPYITIAPLSDLPVEMRERVDPTDAGYVLHISTHTHTPLPPMAEKATFEGTPRPGVTTKDVRLAQRVERLYEAMGAGEAM